MPDIRNQRSLRDILGQDWMQELMSFGKQSNASLVPPFSNSLHGIEASLSPAERNIVDYHRNTLNTGMTGRDEQGRPVTVYSTGITIPEGPYKGMLVSVPGYVGGRIVNNDDELYRIWRKEINAGRWPMYRNAQDLNRRSQEIHHIMDYESPNR